MTKDRNHARRESRKPRRELPAVPDLGRLSMPRKTNRAAARSVAAGEVLWDRRRVERKARKVGVARASARTADARHRQLRKPLRKQMLQTMTGWAFDPRAKDFVPFDSSAARLDELISAIVELGGDPVEIRVRELSFQEASRVRGYLPRGSRLLVSTLRHEGPMFS